MPNKYSRFKGKRGLLVPRLHWDSQLEYLDALVWAFIRGQADNHVTQSKAARSLGLSANRAIPASVKRLETFGLIIRTDQGLEAAEPLEEARGQFLWTKAGDLQYDRTYIPAKAQLKIMPLRQNAVYFWLLGSAAPLTDYPGACAVGGGHGHRKKVLSRQYIARGLRLTRESVRKYLVSLEKLGLIQVKEPGKKKGIVVLLLTPSHLEIWRDRQPSVQKANMKELFALEAPAKVSEYKNVMWRKLESLGVPRNGKGGIIEILRLSERCGWYFEDWLANLNDCEQANSQTAFDRKEGGQRAVQHPGYLFAARLRLAVKRWANKSETIWTPEAQASVEYLAGQRFGTNISLKNMRDVVEGNGLYWFEVEQDIYAAGDDFKAFCDAVGARCE